VASLTLTGAAPTVSVNTNQTITPAGASLTLAGKTPTESWTLTPTSGALAFDQTFKQPVLDHAIFPRTGSLLFLGRVIADLDTAITPSAGTLSASGIIPTQAIRLNTATGSLTLQGYQPATTVPGNVNLIATSGALTITGQSARWNIGVIPSAGSLTLTGTQPAPPNISLTPSAGSLTFNSEASLLFTSPYPCAGRWGTFRWGYRTWCHDIAPQQYTTDDIDLTFHRLSLAVTNTSSTDFVIASITPVFNAMGKRPQHYQAFVDENDLEYVSVGVTQSSRADFVIYDIRPSLNVRKKWRSNT
jgi:hypothetical protein